MSSAIGPDQPPALQFKVKADIVLQPLLAIPTHLNTGTFDHLSSVLSASKPETTSNNSSSMPLWRKRWKVRLRSSSNSLMFFSERCIAAKRLAFSLARDSVQARNS